MIWVIFVQSLSFCLKKTVARNTDWQHLCTGFLTLSNEAKIDSISSAPEINKREEEISESIFFNEHVIVTQCPRNYLNCSDWHFYSILHVTNSFSSDTFKKKNSHENFFSIFLSHVQGDEDIKHSGQRFHFQSSRALSLYLCSCSILIGKCCLRRWRCLFALEAALYQIHHCSM